jgi:hypothetical protein
MNYRKTKKMLRASFLALLAPILLASPSFALTVDLAAVEAVWTTPDTAAPVAMWGFITDPGACPGVPVAWDVGPVIDVPSGEDLTINLRNCLSESVSIFIPGQFKNTTPVTFQDGDGRTRVSSFDTTVAPDGTDVYTWTTPKEGTYLYQSGTFVAKQVPKGLYGGLVVRGSGYPAAAQEEVLVYSEIDPDLNNAAAGAGVGARINNYLPKYFLINGATYPNTENIIVTTGTDILLRFVNAGLQTYVPTLQGLYMSVFAEDGNLLPYAHDKYQIELTAAKTMDAIINVGSEGRYGLYDRSLHLVDGAATGGGMLVFIQTLANQVPIANTDTYDVTAGILNSIAAPGVLVNDSDPDAGPSPLTAFQTGTPPPGVLVLNTDGSFDYTPAGTVGAVETFQYYAHDGLANSAPATVTLNVIAPNIPPVARNDRFSVPRNQTAILDILANDSDSDGTIDTASVLFRNGTTTATTTRGGTVDVNIDGTVTYTPTGGGGADYFWYTVKDNQGDISNEARVRISRVRATAPAAPNGFRPRRKR